MYQVYDSRAADIEKKHQIGEEIKASKEVEKNTVTKDILDYEDEIRRKKEEEWRVTLSSQGQYI